MQHLGANFLDLFGCFNLVSLSVLLKKYGLIFKGPVATLPPTPQLAYTMWSIRISCNAIIYPS